MSENMSLYNTFRNTPDEAKKTINDGKLKGKTDINPMFRIEQLTKQFGPCGIGWKVVPTRIEYLAVPQRDEVMCFVDINLYYKQDGQWSEPVFGTGGSMLVENFRSAGIKSNDDGYKMAYTDAISVACKLLGMSADVYWAAGETKYNRDEPEAPTAPRGGKRTITAEVLARGQQIDALIKKYNMSRDDYTVIVSATKAKSPADMTADEFSEHLKLVQQRFEAAK